MTLFILGLMLGLYPMFLAAAFAAGMMKGAQTMTRTLTAIPKTVERVFTTIKNLLNEGKTHEQKPNPASAVRPHHRVRPDGVRMAGQKERFGQPTRTGTRKV